MLSIYRTFIRSRFDYGRVIYRSARVKVLRHLDTVHYIVLRFCSGAFRLTLTDSLYVMCPQQNLWQSHVTSCLLITTFTFYRSLIIP